MKLAVLAVGVVALATGEVSAERGHAAYERMLDHERQRAEEARERAMYSCKRKGNPLLTIETDAWHLEMFSTGALRFTLGKDVVDRCLTRKVIDHVRWQLGNVAWRTRPAASPCSDAAMGSTSFTFRTVRGRRQFRESACAPTLSVKSRERLAEIQAILESAVRSK